MAWDRTNKLNAIIQEKVYVVLFRLKDPRMVLDLKLSPDRSECHIYYSVLGSPGQRSATQHALDDARGHIQTEIARSLKMRHTPHLRFLFDESIEGSIRIAALLKTLNPESDSAGEKPTGAVEEAGSEPSSDGEDDDGDESEDDTDESDEDADESEDDADESDEDADASEEDADESGEDEPNDDDSDGDEPDDDEDQKSR